MFSMKNIKYIICIFCILLVSTLTYAKNNTSEYVIDKQGHQTDETVKPIAESDVIESSIVVASKNSDKNSNFSMSVRNYMAEESVNVDEVIKEKILEYNISEDDEIYLKDKPITYIRHSRAVTDVGNKFEWKYFDNVDKWKLFVDDSPYSIGYAKSGFYRLSDIIYYFDDDEYMVTGVVIDNQNIKYIFDNTGALISREVVK